METTPRVHAPANFMLPVVKASASPAPATALARFRRSGRWAEHRPPPVHLAGRMGRGAASSASRGTSNSGPTTESGWPAELARDVSADQLEARPTNQQTIARPWRLRCAKCSATIALGVVQTRETVGRPSPAQGPSRASQERCDDPVGSCRGDQVGGVPPVRSTLIPLLRTRTLSRRVAGETNGVAGCRPGDARSAQSG